MNTGTAIATTLVLMIVWGSAPAHAQCRKWSSGLSVGEQSQNYPGRKLPTQTEIDTSLAKERFFYSKQFSDSGEEACQKAARYANSGIPGPGVVISAEQVAPDLYRCFVDKNNNGTFEDTGMNPDLLFTDVVEVDVTTDECCQFDSNAFPTPPHPIEPDKFYKTNPATMVVEEMNPAPGLSFQSSDVKFGGLLRIAQTDQIRASAAVGLGPNTLWSDLAGFDFGDPGVPIVENDSQKCKDTPASGPQGILWYERGKSTYNDCAAEIDHIIPRTDVHGCPCGSNSYKNAQVISRKLNNWLSNDCNPNRPAGRARLKIIEGYQQGSLPRPRPPTPVAAHPHVDLTQAHDGNDAASSSPNLAKISSAGGSCSAAVGSHGLGQGTSIVVLALATVIRRRRRRPGAA